MITDVADAFNLNVDATTATIVVATIAAGAVVVSAAVAGIVALLNTGRTNRNAHRQWQREQRLTAYVLLLRTVTATYAALAHSRAGVDVDKLRDEYNAHSSGLVLLGPPAVAKIIDRLGSEIRAWQDDPTSTVRSKAVSDDLDKLAEASRKALQPPRFWWSRVR